MNMTKIAIKASIVLGTTFGLGLSVSAQSAQAATWHKGTPTTIRGTWKTKAIKTKLSSGKTSKSYDQVTFTKNGFSNYSFVGSSKLGLKAKSVKYAVKGKYTYVITATFAKGVSSTVHVKKSSNKVIVLGSGTKNTNPAKYYKA